MSRILEKFDEAGALLAPFVSAVQVPADKDKPFDVSSDNDVPLPRSTTQLSSSLY